MVPASVRRKLRAAWTPERRKAQAERMRKLASRRGAPRPPSELKRLNGTAEAIIYLRKATLSIQNGYKEGAPVTDADPYVFLALRALTSRD